MSQGFAQRPDEKLFTIFNSDDQQEGFDLFDGFGVHQGSVWGPMKVELSTAGVKLPFEFGIAKALNMSEVSVTEKKNTKGIRNPREAVPTSLLTRIVQVEPLEVKQMVELYAKIDEETAEEEIRTRGRLGTSGKHLLEELKEEGGLTPKKDQRLIKIALEKKVGSLAQVLEESKRTFQAEEEIGKAKELQLRMVVEEDLQARIEVSTEKGLRTMTVEAGDDNMLEVEDALSLRAVISRGQETVAGGLKAALTKAKDVPGKGSTSQSPKKMAWARRKEQVNGKVEVAEQKMTLAVGRTVKEKRSQTSTPMDNREIFQWSFGVKARVLKILKDMLRVESRAT
ncbi:hypothetical protein ACLOJK_005038 [Asimina triloba]